MSNPNPIISFILGRKGGRNPVIDGYRYCTNGGHNGRKYFRCIKFETCKARVTLEGDNLVSPIPHHSHPSQEVELAVLEAKQTLKRNAAQTDTNIKTLVAQATSSLSAEAITHLDCNLESLYASGRKSRRIARAHPPDITDFENINIPPSFLENNQKENMLLWDSGFSREKRRSFMFGSLDNAELLTGAKELWIDATFKSAPKPFYQMLSIHGLFETGWHFPLIYGLMPGKTQVMYDDFLAFLDGYAEFDPMSVLCDYEITLHNAIHTVWPSCTVRGCYFHFTQATWRKMQAFELVTEYKVLSSPVRKWYKIINALHFLEPSEVVQTWNDIRTALPIEMLDFATYFESTWIGTGTTPPTFDIALWNHYDAVLAGLPRSNNAVEGWNNGFSTLVKRCKPSFWSFLETVRLEEALTFVKKVKHRGKVEPPRREKRWADYDDRLTQMVEDQASYMDTLEFLTCVGDLVAKNHG